MSNIRSLSVGLEAHLTDLKRDFANAGKMADDWAKSLEAKAANIRFKLPEMPTPAGISGTSSAGSTSGSSSSGRSAEDTGAQIGDSLAASMAPLTAFVARFESQFNKVGATIIELAKRIDGEMKFPKTQAGFDHLRGFVRKTFVDAEGEVTKFGQRVDSILGTAKGVHKFADSVSSMGSVVKRSIDGIQPDRINFNPATKSLQGLNATANAATGHFRALGSQIAVSLGAFALVYKSVGAIKDGIKGASDLNETLSKTDAILGGASVGVKQWADDMASRFGLVKQETLDIAAGIGGLGKGLGKLSGQGLEDFTKQFTGLAADLSSFGSPTQ